MSGILTLSACASGLRVGVFRMFGPFQRPFLVPWSEIDPEPATALLAPMTKLGLGKPPIGSLKIDARTWQRLRQAAPGASSGGGEPISRGRAAHGYLLQWVAINMFAGCFFYFVSRVDSAQPGIPAAVCFGWPATVFGIGQAIRILRQL